MNTTIADADGVRILRAELGSIDGAIAYARKIAASAERNGNAGMATEYRWLLRELEALKAQQDAQGAVA